MEKLDAKQAFIEKANRCIRGSADDLRAQGFAVLIHDDDNRDGYKTTRWCLARERPDGLETVRGEGPTDADALDRIRLRLAVKYDKLHHAPMCPANHYCGQRAPQGPCNCGAATLAATE